MTHYIDKAIIVAEIKRRIKECDKLANAAADNNLSNTQQANELLIRQYTSLLHFLDTLEVKEEILDKEGKAKLMKKCVHKAYKRGYDMGVLQTTNKMNHNIKEVDLEKEIKKYIEDNICGYCVPGVEETAKYFFELGMAASNKVHKGE